ncbi:MAG: hypothetical protein LBN19_01690 [Endomicrobium sp.]|jgi:hypothetical protein|nr:hypothetical protein [Endomicrobium sp.]
MELGELGSLIKLKIDGLGLPLNVVEILEGFGLWIGDLRFGLDGLGMRFEYLGLSVKVLLEVYFDKLFLALVIFESLGLDLELILALGLIKLLAAGLELVQLVGLEKLILKL